MLKKFVVLVACLGVLQLSSCTSKDSKDDESEDMAMDVADAAEIETVEGEQSLDIAADDPSASLSTDDALPEDALGEASGSPAPPEDPLLETPPSEIAGSEPAPPVIEETLPADTLGDSGTNADSVPPVVDNMESASSALSEAPKEPVSEAPKSEPKPMASYRKVETTPWREGGKLLNSVYIARSGDSWASVSKMIYGSEKVSDLKKMNPAIKGRKVKVGDKLYYNSPHRPDDESNVRNYFEDSGIAPEVYIAKSGDNLKKVAKELLGTEQGWKELYAINDFESKGALDEGTQIRYWKSAPPAAPPAEVAAAQPPLEEAPPAGDMPPPPPQADMPIPAEPPPEMAPPPPPPDMAMNEAPPPPPPPPVEAIAPPPPPPPMDAGKPMADGSEAMEDDQMTTLAAGAVVAVGLALFMIMRRRRKKELEQAIQDTQVG